MNDSGEEFKRGMMMISGRCLKLKAEAEAARRSQLSSGRFGPEERANQFRFSKKNSNAEWPGRREWGSNRENM